MYKENIYLLPYLFRCATDKTPIEVLNSTLETWILGRPINTNREHVSNVLESLGLDGLDTFKLLVVNRACSLNDTYWIDYQDSELTFEKVNLYENRFDKALEHITFFGNKSSLGVTILPPETTTESALGKCWMRENGTTYLYKKGHQGVLPIQAENL